MKRTLRWEYAEPYEPEFGFVADQKDVSDFDTYDETTAEKVVQKDVALAIQSDIRDAVDAHYNEYGGEPECIILGQHEYAILDAFHQARHDHSLKNGIEGVDVVTVPGRMVHVPKPHEHAIWDEVSNAGE